MDNAQKAIMIGVGLFITIIIISAVLLITNLGSGLISGAQTQMSGMSTVLQNQITAKYDGKILSGADVINTVEQYQDSNDLSIRIVVSEAKVYNTGKYLLSTDATAGVPQAGGLGCVGTGDNNSYIDLVELKKKDSLAKIQETGGVVATQTYYSYVLKDTSSDTVMGILFVRKGINYWGGVQ